jgi:hypothetical protein
MTSILVWVLVSLGGRNVSEIVYSPPMADLESCQRIQKAVERYAFQTQCVQIRVPK